MFDLDDNLRKVRQLVHQLNEADLERWSAFGSSRWWILLLFFLVPWIVWAKLAHRNQILETLLFGSLVCVIIKCLDLAGYFFDLWDYPVEFVPLLPSAWAFDMSMVPVAYMLLHQYFRTWKSFLPALLVMAVLYAFVGEPLCNYLRLVHYYGWHYLYSFFLYITIGITIRALIVKLKKIQAPAA